MTQLSESRKNYGRPIIERFKDSVDEAIGQLAKHRHFTNNRVLSANACLQQLSFCHGTEKGKRSTGTGE